MMTELGQKSPTVHSKNPASLLPSQISNPPSLWVLLARVFLFHLTLHRMSNALRRHHKTYSGCWTCRARKVKCDEGRPTCRQCRRNGRECEGYNVRLRWVIDEEADSDLSHQTAQSQRSRVALSMSIFSMVVSFWADTNRSTSHFHPFLSGRGDSNQPGCIGFPP